MQKIILTCLMPTVYTFFNPSKPRLPALDKKHISQLAVGALLLSVYLWTSKEKSGEMGKDFLCPKPHNKLLSKDRKEKFNHISLKLLQLYCLALISHNRTPKLLSLKSHELYEKIISSFLEELAAFFTVDIHLKVSGPGKIFLRAFSTASLDPQKKGMFNHLISHSTSLTVQELLFTENTTLLGALAARVGSLAQKLLFEVLFDL